MEKEATEILLNEVKEIKRLMHVLAHDKIAEIHNSISKKYLTTDQRKKMYGLCDGTRSNKEIADELGITSEAVRQFTTILEEEGIIEYVTGISKSRFPKRIY